MVMMLALFAGTPVLAVGPARVLILRHAEKIDEDLNSVLLSPRGDERAAALEQLFVKSKGRPEPLSRPDFIFAGKNKKSSHRPVITVTPLAKSLKLEINAEYISEEPKKLADELLTNKKYDGKTILICWRHSTLPELATLLKATNAPKDWKDSVFDRVWDITYKDGTGTLTNRPQHLLSSDSKK